MGKALMATVKVELNLTEQDARRLRRMMAEEIETTQARANMIHTTEAEKDVFAWEISLSTRVWDALGSAIATCDTQ